MARLRTNRYQRPHTEPVSVIRTFGRRVTAGALLVLKIVMVVVIVIVIVALKIVSTVLGGPAGCQSEQCSDSDTPDGDVG